jgi:integrase
MPSPRRSKGSKKYNKFRDFRKFHVEQARGFKTRLLETTNATGRPLSAATIKSTLASLKAFFEWLGQEPGYRSRLKPTDAAYFSPSENLARIASAHRYTACPTLRQIETVLAVMPFSTEIERRDRALVAFAILTGAREGKLIIQSSLLLRRRISGFNG